MSSTSCLRSDYRLALNALPGPRGCTKTFAGLIVKLPVHQNCIQAGCSRSISRGSRIPRHREHGLGLHQHFPEILCGDSENRRYGAVIRILIRRQEMPSRNKTVAPASAEHNTLYVAVEISRKSGQPEGPGQAGPAH